jgi:uncharacterized protein YutE (UPF0331/DUF86 family)/predicted nucleotidyltransferase
MLRPPVLENAIPVISAIDAIDAVYCFGSTARDNRTPLSDVDLAVLLAPHIPAPEYGRLKTAILTQLMETLRTDRVDLVLFNQAPPLLAYNVLREGKVIFCRDSESRHRFEVQAIQRYLDTLPLRAALDFALVRRGRAGRIGRAGNYRELDMADRASILDRLRRLERYVTALQNMQHISWEEFQEDIGKQWQVEHGLQLCVQSVLDVATHLISAMNLGMPTDYTEALVILGRSGVIPQEFAQEIKGMAGFRNILVHEYTDVDTAEVYRHLLEDLDHFRAFIGYIIEFLG